MRPADRTLTLDLDALVELVELHEDPHADENMADVSLLLACVNREIHPPDLDARMIAAWDDDVFDAAYDIAQGGGGTPGRRLVAESMIEGAYDALISTLNDLEPRMDAAIAPEFI